MRNALSSWRLPGWRAFVPELAVLFGIPVFNAVTAIIDGKETSYVLLTTTGLTVLLLVGIASVELLAQPFRHHLLAGKELIDTIDGWLRDAGYGRAPSVMTGYSHTILATHGTLSVYIGIGEGTNMLTFASARQEDQSDTQIISQMTEEEWATLRYDMQLELTRFGTFYQVLDDPFKVTFWTTLSVGEDLNAAQVLDRFIFIARADQLVRLLVQRTVTTVLLTTPNAPMIGDLLKSTAEQAAGTSATTTVEPGQASATTTTRVP